MCTFYKRYLSLCADWGESPSGVADKLGIARSTVTKWKKGGNPTDGNLQRIASFFGVSMEWLRDGLEPKKDELTKPTIPPGFLPMPEMTTVPIVGRIACGTPILAEQNIEGTICIPVRWRADFILVCDGDSMEPKIHKGDLVAIRRQPEVENGEIAAVRIGEEATLKRVYWHDGFLELRAENPAYGSKILAGEDAETVTIEGKAIGLCRDL